MIAAECSYHVGMHLYEDLMMVENVDANNKPVALGEVGTRLLVTVLFSRTQPLIRYEIADRVRMTGQSCPCGRLLTLIEDIHGCTGDVVYLPGVDGSDVAIQNHYFRDLVEEVPVSQWQLVQGNNCLNLLLCGLQREGDELALANTIRTWPQARGAVLRPTQHLVAEE